METTTQNPATLSIKHFARPENQGRLSQALDELSEVLQSYLGFISMDIVRPSGNPLEYHVIVKFKDVRSLNAWLSSKQRSEWHKRLIDLSSKDLIVKVEHGFANWLADSRSKSMAPWKLDVITWLAIYPLICGLILLLAPVLAKTSMWMDNLILTIILIPLLSRLVMPFMFRIFGKWLKA